MSWKKFGRGRRPTRRVDGQIDLGEPTQMVGYTGFVPHTGGGRCCECKRIFAVLLQNGMCAECAGENTEPFGRPLKPLDGKPNP